MEKIRFKILLLLLILISDFFGEKGNIWAKGMADKKMATKMEASNVLEEVPTGEKDGEKNTEKGDGDSKLPETGTKIVPKEIDLGDYMTQMTVGEKQLLVVTLLPLEASNTTVTFHSSNKKVASVNGLGRITALIPGKTVITVKADQISQSFELIVTEKEDIPILVTDIEVQEYDKELEVENTLSLFATVLPSDATKPELSFASSDTSIATVNSTGIVKGIRKGQVEIIITADQFSKRIPVNVIVKTKQIKTDTSYLVLKPGTSYSLMAKVEPKEADQELTYESTEERIAQVTEEGVITAKERGSTTILISNKDISAAVAVIVNEDISYQEKKQNPEKKKSVDSIIHQYVNAKQEKIISGDLLKVLYQRKENMIILGENYEIEIQGNKIVNEKNCLYTDIERKKKEGKEYFTLNKGEALCGEVIVRLKEPAGKYLYLYNEAKEKYQRIEMENLEELHLTTPGKYMILKERKWSIPDYLVSGGMAGSILLSMLTVLYIVIKKKYWFW